MNRFLVALLVVAIPRYTVTVEEVAVVKDQFAVSTEDPNGDWVHYTDHVAALADCGTGATTIWYPLPLVPTQNEPNLLCHLKTGEFYALRNYTNGQWRNGTAVTPAPLAWAKINSRTAP